MNQETYISALIVGSRGAWVNIVETQSGCNHWQCSL